MTNSQWGATPEEWDFWANDLGLSRDLLPVVCNLNATISPFSRMRKIGKTPSTYRDDGTVAGMTEWTKHVASPEDIATWSANPDYGICIHTRHVHAFDVDIDDKAKATEFWEMLRPLGGAVRWRENSTRFLVMFDVSTNPLDVMRETSFGKEFGVVEYYSLKKQFVAAGTHESGVRYQWSMM